MLLGRSSELDDLCRLSAGLVDGAGFSVIVQGGAGIGKTIMLDALADSAESHAWVLRACGTQRESELVFAGLGELLHPVLPLIERLPNRQRDILRSSLSLGDVTSHSDLEVFVAATNLVMSAAASRPVLCLVDDGQWMDAASLDALLFAAKRLRTCAIGFVFATRDDLVSRLDATSIPRLPLPPLDDDAAGCLVRSTDPNLSDSIVAGLVEAADGYPLALIEFTRHVARPGMHFDPRVPLPVSERVERIYGEQAGELPAATRTALIVLAAEQTQAHIVGSAMTRLGLERSSLDAAVDAGLVRLAGGQYAFRHPLARSAIYHSATQAERRAAHRALARVLRAAQPELAAWHEALGSVMPDERLAQALQDTAETARRRGGRLAEARALEMAARLSTDDDRATGRLLSAGVAALHAGEHAMARKVLTEVVGRSSDVRVLADAQHQLAQLEFWRDGRVPANLFTAAEQVELIDPVRAARLLSFALVPLISDCRVTAALPTARRAWSLIDHACEPFDVAFRVAHVLIMAADPDGAGLTHRAAAAAEDAGDLVAMIMISQPLWWLERYDDARRLLALAVAEARASDALWMLCHGLINQAELERRTGRPVLAHGAAAEALEIAEQLGEPMQRAEALVQLAAAEAQLGDAVRARAHAEHARRIVEPRTAGATELQLTAAQALARVALDVGRPTEAINELQPLVDLVIDRGLADPAVMPCIADLLDAHAAAGHDGAARLETWLTETAQRCGRRWAVLAAARAAAVRSPRTELDRLRQALADDDRAAGILTAQAWLTYGELVRRHGERGKARPALAHADQMFRAAGARSWYERVAAELRACGESAKTTASAPPLTPQEDRIARLVATGARNREIAQRLSLSEKTVETHLAAVFRKLGVRSRTELAARYATSR